MSHSTGKRILWTRTFATLWLGLFVICSFVYPQQQVSGKVINRNGNPQAGCQVEFSWNAKEPPTYRLTTNNEGIFYLTGPRYGTYTVWVRRGQQQYSTTVTIDDYGLHPSTLVVSW